ncbi:MAG: enoyl-CoA hydratase/isomerase family protein [Alicyclobacillus sp.]|nr:enoyl-CoA hydratase/isomerase family protein [Alicyclobacillus sp.]
MGTVRVEVLDGIALVTIDNPPMNVLSSDIGRQLDVAIHQLEADSSIAGVVITGAGDRAFMAGADIKEFPQRMEEDNAEALALTLDEVFTRLSRLGAPTVAALNGLALGGGCELALACDFRVAEEQVIIGLPEIKLGVFPGGGGTQRLPRLIGMARAKRMILTGEPVSADDAYQMGLVDRVVPPGQSVPAALDFVQVFRDRSQAAIRLAKQAMEEGADLPLEAGLRLEAKLFGQVFQTPGAREGITAFLEKRTPNFRHK